MLSNLNREKQGSLADTVCGPCRRVLMESQQFYEAQGHENDGVLTLERGFVPMNDPLLSLPDSHQVWDDMARRLPDMYCTLSLREEIERMPILSALEDDLSERHLLRASCIIGILAHAYWWVQHEEPSQLPDSIKLPWQQLSVRLKRSAPCLCYTDLILYNWKFKADSKSKGSLSIDSLDLLVPTVNNQAEKVFYLAQVEALYKSAPMIGAVCEAQEAIMEGKIHVLKQSLLKIKECIDNITRAFMLIDANRYSPTYCDPVLWAKTVATLAAPFQEGDIGTDGAYFPASNLLDEILGRPTYDSRVGNNSLKGREFYPKYHRLFLDAVKEVSIRSFVEKQRDPCLTGIFNSLVDAYAGEQGFLGLHRAKAYGFLEQAFKVGRYVTVGGFRGFFKEKTWDSANYELETSRLQRRSAEPTCVYARMARRRSLNTIDLQADVTSGTQMSATTCPVNHNEQGATEKVRMVVLDIQDQPLSYQPGDRCAILPHNSEALVAQTLQSLGASGNESIEITMSWKEVMMDAGVSISEGNVKLKDFLKFARLKHIETRTLEQLHAIYPSQELEKMIAQTIDRSASFDLSDALEIMFSSVNGERDPRKLLLPGVLCMMLSPKTHRMYSVSSSQNDNPGELHLTVGLLSYAKPQNQQVSYGDCSSILSPPHSLRQVQVDQQSQSDAVTFPVKIMPARYFRLPADHTKDVVMFAGGSGIGPFRGFLQARCKLPDCGENWLFYTTKTAHNLYYVDELQEYVKAGKLKLFIAISREDKAIRFNSQGVAEVVPGTRRRMNQLIQDCEGDLWNLLLSESHGGRGAYFYVCGRAGLEQTVRTELCAIIDKKLNSDVRGVSSISVSKNSLVPSSNFPSGSSEEFFYSLHGEGRFMKDVFTTYFNHKTLHHNVSDVIVKNNESDGIWIVVEGKVYDLTKFIHVHPGGFSILLNTAGRDATHAFTKVKHNTNPEVMAQMAAYCIGDIKEQVFSDEKVSYSYRMWVDCAYVIVEVLSAIRSDFRTCDMTITSADPDKTVFNHISTKYALDTHARFTFGYLDIIEETLQKLWEFTPSNNNALNQENYVSDRIRQVKQSSNASYVLRTLNPERGTKNLSRAPASVCRDRTQRLEEEDLSYVTDTLKLVREGLLIFEEVASTGGCWLLVPDSKEENDVNNGKGFGRRRSLPQGSFMSVFDRLIERIQMLFNQLAGCSQFFEQESYNNIGDMTTHNPTSLVR